jgi:hypothetical protein
MKTITPGEQHDFLYGTLPKKHIPDTLLQYMKLQRLRTISELLLFTTYVQLRSSGALTEENHPVFVNALIDHDCIWRMRFK